MSVAAHVMVSNLSVPRMTMIKKLLQGPDRLWVCGWIAACALATTSLAAQTPAPRIRAEVSNSQMSLLKGSQHPLAQAQNDAGRMSSDVRLNGMSIVFNRSAAQQADLEALIAAQQDPASPLYHQWLNPDQFAARFGMAQSDIDKVQGWLAAAGLLDRFSGAQQKPDPLLGHGRPGGAGVPDPDAFLHCGRREALRSCHDAFSPVRYCVQCCHDRESG